MRKVTGLWSIFLLIAGFVAACGGSQQTTTTTDEPALTGATTWVRFVNAMPDGPAVDALIGDFQVATDKEYQEWGGWVEVVAGEQDLALRVGEGIELSDVYTFEPNKRYWVFAYGMMNPQNDELSASFLIAPEEEFEPSADDAWVRFVNLAADGESYAFIVTTGGSWTMLFSNQNLGTVSEYKLGPIQQNSFEVLPARDTSMDAVATYETSVQVGLLYNFIVVGRTGNDSIEVFQIAESADR